MTSNQSLHLHRSSSSAWEDDAWKIDSDDEEFVKASRARSSPAMTSRQSSRNVSGRSMNGSSSKIVQSSPTVTRHAPPARPHPLEFGSNSSIPQSTNAGNVNSWMLVERSNSTESAKAVNIPSNTSTIDTVSSLTLDETVTSTQDEEAQLRSLKEAKFREMKAAIQDDLMQVLDDPTTLLQRISLRSPSVSPARLPEIETNPNASSTATTSPTTSRIMPSFDTANAMLAVDGIMTNLPASSDPIVELPWTNLEIATDRDSPEPSSNRERRRSLRSERKRASLLRCLNKDVVPMEDLRKLAWSGVPDDMRPIVWMLLLGYLPTNKSTRKEILSRKRLEYMSGVRNAFQHGKEELDQTIWHQISIDVPRTNPGIKLWQREATQRALERILYVWAIRHPASGYVQGINDLATPFFEVFLSAYIKSDPEQYDVGLLPETVLQALEADTFWCLSKLLDGIQDNYVFAQPGIQRQVRRMSELVARINPALHAHLEHQNVEYMQFAFRWMNCLLMRELSVQNIVRLWDSYLAEGADAFSEFHLFVCAAFLNKWSNMLQLMDFQGIIMFLQGLPTQQWSTKETELLLADAFVKKSLFGGTAHLTN